MVNKNIDQQQDRYDIFSPRWKKSACGVLIIVGFGILMIPYAFEYSFMISAIVSLIYMSVTAFCICIIYFANKKHVLSLGHIELSFNLLFSVSLLLIMYTIPVLYSLVYVVDIAELTIAFCIFTSFLLLFLTIHSVRKINNGFSKIYFISGKCVFLDDDAYTKIKCEVPAWYYRFLIVLLGLTALLGLYSKSFYSMAGFGIAASFALFGQVLNMYPMFISGVYAYTLHRRVEKTFKKRLISDKWGLLEKNPELAERILGKNPEKRPIQYEEIFPNSRT